MFNKKKKHFKRKLFDIERTMWDLEFKKDQALHLREQVRLDRDNRLNQKEILETQFKETKDKKIEEAIKANNDLIERYEKQMKMIDDQVSGGQPAEDDPTGEGIVGRIARLHELKIMLTNYIKTL